MATDMQTLVVALEARTRAFENAMNKANGVATKRARSIETRFQRMNKNVSTGFTALGGKIAGAFAVAGGMRGAQKLLDTSTRIDNALKVAGLSGDELTRVYDRLFASAQKNAAPLESLVELYGRVSLVQKELGASSEDLDRFAENIGTALRVAGTDAQSASGALLQLSQALGAGTVRAEEFSSIQEGALPILQAVAAGLEEAGGSVAKLRGLVIDGKLSSAAFFRAFEAGAATLEEKVANSTFTVAQGFTRVNNALIDAAGRMDDGSQASKGLATALDTLSTAIKNFDVSIISDELGAMSHDISNTIDDLNRWVDAYGRVKAAIGQGDFAGALSAAGGFFVDPNGPPNPKVAGGKGPRTMPAGGGSVDTVSTKDAPAAGKDKKGAKTKKSEYAREIEQIKERTAALQAETAAMAGLNPLVNDYGFAVEKASAVQELLNAAQKAGLAITPELKASIESLATGYATAVVEAEKLAESQDNVRKASEELRDLGKDVMGGFISDMRSGKSAAEALQGALDKVLDKLIDIGLESVFSGSKGGGLLSGIASLFGFAGGGYTGDGGKMQPAGVVHKGEYVFSKKATERIGVGNLDAMHRNLQGFASGGAVGAPRIPSGGGGGGGSQQIVLHIVGEEGAMFTPRVREISGQTANVVVTQAAPGIIKASIGGAQQSRRDTPGRWR